MKRVRDFPMVRKPRMPIQAWPKPVAGPGPVLALLHRTRSDDTMTVSVR
jgi:hypothetical protein